MQSNVTTTANKATESITALPRIAELLNGPQTYLIHRDAVFKVLAQHKVLHYIELPPAIYHFYMGLPADAPVPVRYVRPEVAHYGDDNLEFTVDQLKLIDKLWNLMDAITHNLVAKLDPSIRTHILHRVTVDNVELSDLIAALDAEFLAPGLRALPELYQDLRDAKGITSISELLQYIKYLDTMQLMAERQEDPGYIVTAMSACLNRMGHNEKVVRYHELRGADPENPTHFREFLTAQLKLMSYKKTPTTPTQSGILNPVMASSEVNIAGLAEQVRVLSLQLAKVTASLNAPGPPPNARSDPSARHAFCSTHGLCSHTSDKCNNRSPLHNLKDTQQEWSNKAQNLAHQAKRRPPAPHE